MFAPSAKAASHGAKKNKANDIIMQEKGINGKYPKVPMTIMVAAPVEAFCYAYETTKQQDSGFSAQRLLGDDKTRAYQLLRANARNRVDPFVLDKLSKHAGFKENYETRLSQHLTNR
jgi:hypothetical protein